MSVAASTHPGADDRGPAPQLVPRRRLLDRLALRDRRRLTLIVGGAGYGKTALIGQAVAEASDGAREEVVAGATALAATASDLVRGLADGLGTAPSADAVVDAVWARSPNEVVLWVDDVHLLQTDAETVLAALLERLPANGHLVLVGRRAPGIATRRLELADEVVRIDEDDLRFDRDEIVAFHALRGSDGGDATGANSDGWPALMALEASSGRRGAIDYLAEEVLTSIPDDRLEALRRLALADLVDDDLVRSVTSFGGTADDLVGGLPLVERRVDGVVLHDLLRDALLTSGVPDGAPERIAEALLERGNVLDAARRFARIGDAAGCERVARRLIADLHVGSDAGARRAVVDLLGSVLGDDPVALTLRAVTAAMLEPGAAEEQLEVALARSRASGATDLEAVCLVRLADLAYDRGDVEEIEAHRDRLVELADRDEPVAGRLRVLPEFWIRRLTGSTHEVVGLVDEYLADPVVDDEMRAVAEFNRVISLAYTGHIGRALDEVESRSGELPPGLFANRLGGFVAIQRWMLGLQTAAERDGIVGLLERIEAHGQVHLFVEGAATTAVFHGSAGDADTARRLVEWASSRAAVLSAGAWARHTLSQATAVLDVLDGREDVAAERLDASIPAGGPLDGLSPHIYALTMPLTYLLVPRTRPVWDAVATGPDHQVRVDVARALVALRERDDLAPAAGLPWSRPEVLRPWLPEPLLVEVACAAIAAGNDQAQLALGELRHRSADVLDRLAGSDRSEIAAAATRARRTVPRRPDLRLEITAFGPLAIRFGGVGEAVPVVGARVRDLLGLLVHERKVSRARLIELLWPDKPVEAGQNNLRVNLSKLLDALEPDRDGAPWYVRTDGELVRLDGSTLTSVDVDRFGTLVGAAAMHDVRSPGRALDELLEACELYRGDYLADLSVRDHVYFEGLRLRGQFVAAAVRAADLLIAIGRADEAERLAVRASAAEPLNESVQRVLSSALLARRRIGAARDVIGELVEQLRQLQIPPEPETRALAIRLGVPL